MSLASTPTLEELLAHSGWVRSLARRLAGDPEVWLKALRAPPQRAAQVRAWFAAVLRNVVRRAQRDALRREAREHAAAQRERLPDTSEMLASVTLERAVAAAVTELDEPYR